MMQAVESSDDKRQAVHMAPEVAEPKTTTAMSDDCTPAKRVKIDDSSIRKDTTSFVTPLPRSAVTQQTPLSRQEIQALLWKEAAYNATGNDVVPKRSDYICWDDYFMAAAALSAHRSKDPDHPSGCCIVDASNRIIGIGYNGFPAGCSDDCLPWTTKADNWLHTKTPFSVHAEVNAILNKCSADVAGARLYSQTLPCNECAKVIVQSRIKEVVYFHDPSPDSSSRASRIMLTMAGVTIRQYQPKLQTINLTFWPEDSPPDRSNVENLETVRASSSVSDAARYRDLLRKEANYDPVQVGSTKRSNYLSWDDYFMAMAFLTAQRSKDPNTQVGACIVDTNKRIVGLGYNGFPAGCSDDDLPWARKASTPLHQKYLYVCHAEVNAVLNKCSADVKGATLYVKLFPCNDCAKTIIQAGIKEVVFMADTYHDTDACRASRIMFRMAGVKLRKYIPSVRTVDIELERRV